MNVSIVAHFVVLISSKEFKYFDPCQYRPDEVGIIRGARAGNSPRKSLDIIPYQFTEHQTIIATILQNIRNIHFTSGFTRINFFNLPNGYVLFANYLE